MKDKLFMNIKNALRNENDYESIKSDINRITSDNSLTVSSINEVNNMFCNMKECMYKKYNLKSYIKFDYGSLSNDILFSNYSNIVLCLNICKTHTYGVVEHVIESIQSNFDKNKNFIVNISFDEELYDNRVNFSLIVYND